MSTATTPAVGVQDTGTKPRGRADGEPARRCRLVRQDRADVVCFLWVVPTLGLFLTSFRPLDDANNTGWWTLFTDPSDRRT